MVGFMKEMKSETDIVRTSFEKNVGKPWGSGGEGVGGFYYIANMGNNFYLVG